MTSDRTAHSSSSEKTPALSLVLGGTLQEMHAKTVHEALRLLTKLTTSFTDKPVMMGVLEEGSMVAGVIVPPETEAEILDGIEHLRKGETIPENWTFAQIDTVRDLAELENKTGVERVSFKATDDSSLVVLDGELIESIKGILDGIPLSLGSVRGELYSYSARNGALRARLEPSSGSRVIKINFTDDLDEAMRLALRKQVSVYGLLKRHPVTHEVQEIDARKIRVVEVPGSPQRGRGIWRDAKERGVTVDGLLSAIDDLMDPSEREVRASGEL